MTRPVQVCFVRFVGGNRACAFAVVWRAGRGYDGGMVKVCDEMIGQMAREIARQMEPERIVLFGSWARGQAGADSDVDLLVVEREPFGRQRSRRQEAARIWRCLSPFRVPADVLVYSVAEVDRWKDCRQRIIARALREGRVLYESA